MAPTHTADDAVHRTRSDSIAETRLALGDAIVANWAVAHRLARSIVRDDDKANDVLQDAACRALVHADTFDVSRPPVPWFMRIVRNTALTSLKREKFTCELVDVADRARVEDDILHLERAQELQRAFDMLPRQYRAVLHLRYKCEYEYKTISQTLAIPIGTTKTLIHRARRAMHRLAFNGAV